MKCIGCNTNIETCICNDTYDITEECQDILEDYAEIEASEIPGAKRCKECYFFMCCCPVRGKK